MKTAERYNNQQQNNRFFAGCRKAVVCLFLNILISSKNRERKKEHCGTHTDKEQKLQIFF
jgi:hypothetical protein